VCETEVFKVVDTEASWYQVVSAEQLDSSKRSIGEQSKNCNKTWR